METGAALWDLYDTSNPIIKQPTLTTTGFEG